MLENRVALSTKLNPCLTAVETCELDKMALRILNEDWSAGLNGYLDALLNPAELQHSPKLPSERVQELFNLSPDESRVEAHCDAGLQQELLEVYFSDPSNQLLLWKPPEFPGVTLPVDPV